MNTRLLLRLAAATLLAAGLHCLAQERPSREGLEGREGRGGMLRQLPLMQALDTNNDARISAQEIENAAAALKTLDKNKDGQLTEDELRPAMGAGMGAGMRGGQGRPNPQEMATRLLAGDKNGDGKLSKDELPERMQNRLERADTDKDGALSMAELTAFLEQQQAVRPQGGPGPGEGSGERRAQPPGTPNR
jgi:Ca2+-binding EF-hand superfamily protein